MADRAARNVAGLLERLLRAPAACRLPISPSSASIASASLHVANERSLTLSCIYNRQNSYSVYMADARSQMLHFSPKRMAMVFVIAAAAAIVLVRYPIIS